MHVASRGAGSVLKVAGTASGDDTVTPVTYHMVYGNRDIGQGL